MWITDAVTVRRGSCTLATFRFCMAREKRGQTAFFLTLAVAARRQDDAAGHSGARCAVLRQLCHCRRAATSLPCEREGNYERRYSPFRRRERQHAADRNGRGRGCAE